MNRLAVSLLVLVLLPFSPLPLGSWQKQTKPQTKQLSETQQTAVDEFEAAVKRFEDLIEQLDDPAKQHHMRYELVKVHDPARKARAAELIPKIDRQLLPRYLQNEFKYMKYKVRDSEELYAELQYEQAVRNASRIDPVLVRQIDRVFKLAMRHVPIEYSQPFLDEITTPKHLRSAYSRLARKAIEREDYELADEFIEKWFAQIDEWAVDIQFLSIDLYFAGEEELAKKVCQQVVEYGIENSKPYLAVSAAAGTGMPELVIKAYKKFESLGKVGVSEPHPVEYFLVEAYARQGDYKLALRYHKKYYDEREIELDCENKSLIVNEMIRDGEVELAKQLVEKTQGASSKIYVLLEMASTAAEQPGLRKLVNDLLAECRQLALEHTDSEEIDHWSYYEIASTHFRLEKMDEGRQFLDKLTDKNLQVFGVLAEVIWLAKQIDE